MSSFEKVNRYQPYYTFSGADRGKYCSSNVKVNEWLDTNGNHIQVRSKDSKPYHPIYSTTYRRNVSDKNHAFYFQKQFVYDIKRLNNVQL